MLMLFSSLPPRQHHSFFRSKNSIMILQMCTMLGFGCLQQELFCSVHTMAVSCTTIIHSTFLVYLTACLFHWTSLQMDSSTQCITLSVHISIIVVCTTAMIYELSWNHNLLSCRVYEMK